MNLFFYLFVILFPVAGGLAVYFLRGRKERYQKIAVLSVALLTSAAVWARLFLPALCFGFC